MTLVAATVPVADTASRSTMRTLDVFEAFRRARRPLSLSELAKLADIPASTCHGVMRTLEQAGFLYFVGAREVYPTRRLWDLAETIREHDPVALRLEPELARLRDASGETVILGTRRGDAVLYLMVLESRQSIRYSSRAGDTKPLHSSAIGKALLASLAADTLDRWLVSHRLERVTAATLTRAADLRADLDASRRRGWFVTRGENVADVTALAAPLALGGSLLAVAVAGPTHRMQAVEARIAKRLVQCVHRLGEQSGR